MYFQQSVLAFSRAYYIVDALLRRVVHCAIRIAAHSCSPRFGLRSAEVVTYGNLGANLLTKFRMHVENARDAACAIIQHSPANNDSAGV